MKITVLEATVFILVAVSAIVCILIGLRETGFVVFLI